MGDLGRFQNQFTRIHLFRDQVEVGATGRCHEGLTLQREPGHGCDHLGLHLTSFEQLMPAGFDEDTMNGARGAGEQGGEKQDLDH